MTSDSGSTPQLIRPTWSDTWMAHARVISSRSLCDNRQIGAVIVSSDNSYSVVGYNGPPRGYVLPQDDRLASTASCSNWCSRRISDERSASYTTCISVHAEANALIRADYSRIKYGSIYVTSAICWDCGKMVANSGISNVYMHIDHQADAHRNPGMTIAMLRQCGLEVFFL